MIRRKPGKKLIAINASPTPEPYHGQWRRQAVRCLSLRQGSRMLYRWAFVVTAALMLFACSESASRRDTVERESASDRAERRVGEMLYTKRSPAFDPAATRYLQSVTAPGMISPMRLALAPDDTLVVSDPRAKALFVFSPGGSLIERVNLETRPLGVAVDALGRAILGDADGARLLIRNPGNPLPRMFCVDAGEFKKANDIAIEPVSGLVWIADSGNHRVVACTSEGVFVRAFGAKGANNGDFDYPIGVAVDPAAGEVYVTDQQNGRVQVFDEFGIFKRAVASYGGADGQLVRPAGIALDALNRLYVADLFQSRVQGFDPAGGHLQWIGAPGEDPGKLLLPSDVAIDRHNRLIIASQMTRRIEYIGLDTYTNPVDPGGPLGLTAELTESTLRYGPSIAPSYLCLDVPGSDAGIVASSVRIDYQFALDAAGIVDTNVKCNGRYFEAQARVLLSALWVQYPQGGERDLPITGRLRDGREIAGTLHVSMVGGVQ